MTARIKPAPDIGTCSTPMCAGEAVSYGGRCPRHVRHPSAAPMRVECECSAPDVERLPAYGPDAAQCRSCGSPVRVS